MELSLQACKQAEQVTNPEKGLLLCNQLNILTRESQHGLPSKDIGMKAEVILRDVEASMHKNVSQQRT